MKAVGKENINWQKVDAIGIEQIGYNSRKKILYVKFRNNSAIYLYLDVAEDIYNQLMQQEHKTTFVNKIIKVNYEYDVL